MLRRAILLSSALVLSQPCLAAPLAVPPSKAAYVGEWKGENFLLAIQQDGKIHYKRSRDGSNFDLNIELQSFKGDNFEAGIPFVHTTFVVSKPPHLDKGRWTMTVDGVELTKQ
jgi:hypothetical protein